MSARGKSVPKQTLPGPCLLMMAVSVAVPTFFQGRGPSGVDEDIVAADELPLRFVQHVESAQVQGDDLELGELARDVHDAKRFGPDSVAGLGMGPAAGMDLHHHVLAHLFVNGEHSRVVGVELVDHGMHLDAADAGLAEPTDLPGGVIHVGVHCSEWNKHVVLDADQPVVGPLNLLRTLNHTQHHRLVHPGLPHVALDSVHGVDADGRIAEGTGHVLQHGRGNPVGPYVSVNIYAHGHSVLSVLVTMR